MSDLMKRDGRKNEKILIQKKINDRPESKITSNFPVTCTEKTTAKLPHFILEEKIFLGKGSLAFSSHNH